MSPVSSLTSYIRAVSPTIRPANWWRRQERSIPAQPATRDRHRMGCGSRHRVQFAAGFLCRDLEDRSRESGLSQCRTRAQGVGQGAAGGLHPAGPARPFRSGSVARAFGQDECGVRLGRGGDRWSRRPVPQTGAPGVRRAGERACALRYLLGRGHQHPPRRIPGAWKVHRPGGRWWTSRRRPENWRRDGDTWRRSVAETGDVDISKQPVLVSMGRGIQEKENVAIAEELAEAMGGGGELFAAGGGCQVDGQVAAGRLLRHRPSSRRFIWRAASADRSSTWRASRAIRSSSPSTRIRRRPSSAWRTWESSTTSWSSCRHD